MHGQPPHGLGLSFSDIPHGPAEQASIREDHAAENKKGKTPPCSGPLKYARGEGRGAIAKRVFTRVGFKVALNAESPDANLSRVHTGGDYVG